MTTPFMPKATAKWLVDNTKLTFKQIADFCEMHPLEIQGIADGEVAANIIPSDPVKSGQLTKEEIARCEENYELALKMRQDAAEMVAANSKRKGRYTPIARRQDKPDAISWLVKHHPELSDGQLIKLVGTTKKTIDAIRDRSHWNVNNLNPRDPVLLGLCTQSALNSAVDKAKKKTGIGEQNEAAAS
jgi:hypothetical protein